MGDMRRLDRIEQVVTALEIDIKTMSNAVTDLAGSVRMLVDLQTNQKLLAQEVEYKFQAHQKETEHLIAGIDINSKKLEELQIVFTLLRYPKLLLAGVSLLYVLSIKEVRDIILHLPK